MIKNAQELVNFSQGEEDLVEAVTTVFSSHCYFFLISVSSDPRYCEVMFLLAISF